MQTVIRPWYRQLSMKATRWFCQDLWILLAWSLCFHLSSIISRYVEPSARPVLKEHVFHLSFWRDVFSTARVNEKLAYWIRACEESVHQNMTTPKQTQQPPNKDKRIIWKDGISKCMIAYLSNDLLGQIHTTRGCLEKRKNLRHFENQWWDRHQLQCIEKKKD